MNNLKTIKLKLSSGEWHNQKIATTILKHRVLKTDPTYKFIINADIYIRSNVPVKETPNQDSYYYDLLNILSSQQPIISGKQWVDFLDSKYDISLALGDNYPSAIFPELYFDTIEDRDLLDNIYPTLSESVGPDGLNVLFDFTLQVSGGFIRNKLNMDTNSIRSWLINDLSFNLLSLMMTKESANSSFKVKDSYKNSLELTSVEVSYLEDLFKFNNDLMPTNSNGVSYFWDVLNRAASASLASKQYLFGFVFDKAVITNILNKDFSIDVNSNNRPLNVISKNNIYNPIQQTITLK